MGKIDKKVFSSKSDIPSMFSATILCKTIPISSSSSSSFKLKLKISLTVTIRILQKKKKTSFPERKSIIPAKKKNRKEKNLRKYPWDPLFFIALRTRKNSISSCKWKKKIVPLTKVRHIEKEKKWWKNILIKMHLIKIGNKIIYLVIKI